ncbi:D-isomer specific 2-hydroxyacid dehydrogenase [Dunaliella salina]|uniref:D-isomer specific 2-hydroxyacid dehydrogenase n=1 Tax=Dunaliella salina TaxID=3046 RepID=A0ABQ7GJ58_DUNSA|nr:D-isomer specific 2-hydroxyacid dehydrogenase [Dunaliella salina]|eukprot:KAF5834636.1 D-isomer specific 2-hydroxyacid dehydrogenase [Dunaliella salina]
MDPSIPLHEQVQNAHVLIPTTGAVDGKAINASPNLRLIAQPASGYCNIDIAAARARSIPVTLAPGYNSQAVAEVALCMMLMLARRVDEARAAFQARFIGEPIGSTLHGKVLGIVGMGRVGKCLATAARALGMEVMGTDSKSSREDLVTLLKRSNVVSLHVPLTSTTQGLIGAAELALMRPGAILINCARGPVIDKQALIQALEQGRLGGVGLDVHWIEPADPAECLYRHPRVLALPHLGSVSQEVYQSFASVLFENIIRVREGRELLHPLTFA